MDEKELKIAAKELSRFLELKPKPIDTESPKLKDLVVKAAKMLVDSEVSKISTRTRTCLEELGAVTEEGTKITAVVVSPVPAKKETKPSEDDVSPEEEEQPSKKKEEESVTKKKEKAEKKPEKKESKKVETELDRYGRRAGTVSATIDDLVWEGNTKDQMVKALVKKFPDRYKDNPGGALGKINAHLKTLEKEGLVISESKEGVLKSKQKTLSK